MNTQKQKFVSVGHIVNDTQPHDHLGGGVSYTAVAASRLGLDAHIITKCPANHPYVSYLSSLGVTVHQLPTHSNQITQFKNIYTPSGRRTQWVPSQQEQISSKDFDAIDLSFIKDSAIVIAPVIGEIEKDVFPILHTYGNISVVPQGYLRHILPSGKVITKQWDDFENYAKDIDEIILSDEDLFKDGEINEAMLHTLRAKIPLVIMTQGSQGSTVFSKSIEKVTAFPLSEEQIVDFTGAGDVYAAGFITYFTKTHDMHSSAVFASLYASVKITGIGGIGIDSIPSLQQLQHFMNTHKELMGEFLTKNNLSSLQI